MLLSAGERISMALLSMAIRELGGDAISFTGSQSGIITNDRHVDARIIEVRPFRIQDELARGRIVVIAGYQGVSYKKRGHDARPRRQRHDGRGDGGRARRRILRDLLRRRRRLLRRPARRAGGAAHRHAVLRRDAGDGRGGREGAERAGGRVRQGEGHRHLRARHARAAARPGSVERRHRRPPQSRRACPAPSSASPASATSSCSTASAAPARCWPLLDERGVAGKQLHVFGDRTDGRHLAREPARRRRGCATRCRRALGEPRPLVDGLGAVSVVGAGINATYGNVRAGTAALRGRASTPAGLATSSFRITWMVPRERIGRGGPRAARAASSSRSAPLLPSEYEQDGVALGVTELAGAHGIVGDSLMYATAIAVAAVGARARLAERRAQRGQSCPQRALGCARHACQAASDDRGRSPARRPPRVRELVAILRLADATMAAISRIVPPARRSPCGNRRQNSSTVSPGSRPTAGAYARIHARA